MVLTLANASPDSAAREVTRLRLDGPDAARGARAQVGDSGEAVSLDAVSTMLERALAPVVTSIESMKNEMSELKADISTVKADFSVIKASIARIEGREANSRLKPRDAIVWFPNEAGECPPQAFFKTPDDIGSASGPAVTGAIKFYTCKVPTWCVTDRKCDLCNILGVRTKVVSFTHSEDN
jgi:hypothetical protein